MCLVPTGPNLNQISIWLLDSAHHNFTEKMQNLENLDIKVPFCNDIDTALNF